MNTKLDPGQKNILRLVARDAGIDGWALVAPMIYKHIEKTFPRELLDMEPPGQQEKGRARLTEKGVAVLSAMQYI